MSSQRSMLSTTSGISYGSSVFSVGEGRARVRLIEPVMVPRIVRTEKSIAAIFLGVGSQTESWLFSMGAKDGCGKYVLWALWLLGMTTSLLVLGDVVPHFWVFGCVLALPLPIVAFLLLSQDLVMEILEELELYIVLLLQGVLVTHALMSLTHVTHERKWDIKCLAVLCYVPSIIVMSLMDAYPTRYRRIFQILFSSGGIAVLVTWNLLIIIEHGNLGPLTSQFGDNFTLLLFYCRHIRTAVAHPDAFVVITSMVHTKHEKVRLTKPLPESGVKIASDAFARAESECDRRVEVPRGSMDGSELNRCQTGDTLDPAMLSPRAPPV